METKYLDLHSHTIYSDGGLTPTQLIKLQVANGIDITAVSDHDNFRAYPEAKAAAKKYGIKLIPGVEITTPKYHLLALNFNPNDKEFERFVKYSEDLQIKRARKKVRNLELLGVPLTFDMLEKEYPMARIGSGNIWETMFTNPESKGYLENKHPEMEQYEIYKHYFGDNGIAKDTGEKEGVESLEAIKAVHKAGGIIGIAHPVKDIDHMQELEILLNQGIDFLEIQPNLPERYNQQPFREFAKKNNLPISYGSDYHGPRMARPTMKRQDNLLSKDFEAILRKRKLTKC